VKILVKQQLKRVMRILIVTNLYPTNKKPQEGMFVYEQVESLRNHYVEELDIDVYLVNGSESKINYIKALFSLPFIVKKRKYDLIHVHYGLTLFSVLLVSVPVIVTWHGSDLLTNPAKFVCNILRYKACRSIVVSSNLQEALGYGTVIPCGIDVKKFLMSDDNVKSHHNGWEKKSDKKLQVLFPANPLDKVKNYPLFHNVCMELKKMGINVTEVYLRDIPREKVPSIFWNCAVMVLTSFSEGSPTVLKEAIAAKLPFVSVDVGDVQEWCDLISFGLVVKNRNPRIIAEKVVYLLSKIDDRRTLDNSQAVGQMDIANIARKVKSVYENVIYGEAKS